MLRVTGILITVLCAIAAAVLTWPGFFRIEQTFPIAQLISFRPLLAVGFAVLAVVFLLLAIARPLRGFALSLVLVTGAAAVANGVILLTRGTGTDALPEPTDSSIRVMTWNTSGDATEPGAVAQLAVAMQAGIVSLPETTPANGERIAVAMRDLGQPMWVHHVVNEQEGATWDARYTTLLISPDLGDYSVIESSRDGSSSTGVVPSAVAMPIDGSGPIVVAVHAVAPREDAMDQWQEDLRWLGDQCADANVIMAGDFNATVDHMARLGEGDATLGRCRDAAVDSGNGAVGTWSTDYPRLMGAPIDHVMYSDHWEVTGSIVLPTGSSASDHRPLVVQLEPVD